MAKAQHLLQWFAHPGCAVFIELVESRIMEIQCAAADKLMADTEKGERAAGSEVDEAIKTKFALELLASYRKQKDHHTSTAIPTKIEL